MNSKSAKLFPSSRLTLMGPLHARLQAKVPVMQWVSKNNASMFALERISISAAMETFSPPKQCLMYDRIPSVVPFRWTLDKWMIFASFNPDLVEEV